MAHAEEPRFSRTLRSDDDGHLGSTGDSSSSRQSARELVFAETRDVLRRELVIAEAALRTQLLREPREALWSWDMLSGVFETAHADEVFGWDPAVLTDITSWIRCVHDDDRPRLQRLMGRILEQGVMADAAEHRLLRPNGHWARVITRVRVVRSANGAPVRIVGATRDVTEEREAEERRAGHLRRVETIAGVSRALTRAGLDVQILLDSVVRAVAELVGGSCVLHLVGEERDVLGNFVAAYDVDPQRRERLQGTTISLGVSSVALGPRSASRGFVKSQPPAHAAVDVRVLAAGMESQDVRRLVEALSPASLLIVPLRGAGGVLGVISVAHYDNGRSFDEQDGEVLHEIAALAAHALENAQLYARADRLSRFAETFVGVLGHDLRNPLGAISTSAQLILRLEPDEHTARPAQRIVQSAARMARMIDQLLDFTRIRVGGLSLQRVPVDLGDVCRDVVDEFRNGAAGVPVHVEVCGDPLGAWDPDRVWQLVSNLVGNALAHGTEGGMIAVSVDGSRPDAVDLAVHNSGAIAPSLVPVIFEPLSGGQRPPSRGRRAGLGLGLFIVQQIARAHGGAVEVDSTVEHGTTFRTRLPRDSSPSSLEG